MTNTHIIKRKNVDELKKEISEFEKSIGSNHEVVYVQICQIKEWFILNRVIATIIWK